MTLQARIHPNMTYQYRAAIHLNNTGVELVRQTCVHEAVKCFRDGLYIMRHLISENEQAEGKVGRGSHNSYETPCTTEMIQSLLQDAEQALANSSQTPPASRDSEDMILQIISDDENLSTILSGSRTPSSHDLLTSTIGDNGSLKVKFMVRIEPTATTPSTLKQEQTLHTTIMMYNSGMAYWYLSNFEETPSSYAISLGEERAEHMFHLTYSLLSTNNAELLVGSGRSGVTVDAEPRIMLLTVMTLQCLLELSSWSNCNKKREQFFYFMEKLESLFPTLQILTAIEEQSKTRVSSAA